MQAGQNEDRNWAGKDKGCERFEKNPGFEMFFEGKNAKMKI